jgi:hypothetical protein
MTQGLFGGLEHGIIVVRKWETPLQTKKSIIVNFKNSSKGKQNSQNNKNKSFLVPKMLFGFQKIRENAVKAQTSTKTTF